MLRKWLDRFKNSQVDQDVELKQLLYDEVMKARQEWDQAHYLLQQASGPDEVDIAIYTLEAAERRYQVKLKAAKQAQVRWRPFEFGSYGSSKFRVNNSSVHQYVQIKEAISCINGEGEIQEVGGMCATNIGIECRGTIGSSEMVDRAITGKDVISASGGLRNDRIIDNSAKGNGEKGDEERD